MLKTNLNHKCILLGVALFLLAIGMSGCSISFQPKANNNDSWSLFSDNDNNYSIEYPKGWTARKLSNGDRVDEYAIAYFSSPSLLPATIIVARTEDFYPTEANAIAWGESRIQQRYDDNVLQDIVEDKLSNNQSVLTRTYRSSLNSPTLVKGKDVYIVRSDDIIVLTLLTNELFFEEVISILDDVAESFTTLD